MAVIFHLAFPVANIPETKDFYINGLGCEAGREADNSIIMNMYGHQIVAHVSPEILQQKGIYPRHFGLVLTAEKEWETLLKRATDHHLKFYQSAKHRFPNLPLEHRTFFLEDPFYNLLEFKYYYHYDAIFGLTTYTQVGEQK